MSNEEETSETGEEREAKPTITIAERESPTSDAKPTITIAERESPTSDAKPTITIAERTENP